MDLVACERRDAEMRKQVLGELAAEALRLRGLLAIMSARGAENDQVHS